MTLIMSSSLSHLSKCFWHHIKLLNLVADSSGSAILTFNSDCGAKTVLGISSVLESHFVDSQHRIDSKGLAWLHRNYDRRVESLGFSARSWTTLGSSLRIASANRSRDLAHSWHSSCDRHSCVQGVCRGSVERKRAASFGRDRVAECVLSLLSRPCVLKGLRRNDSWYAASRDAAKIHLDILEFHNCKKFFSSFFCLGYNIFIVQVYGRLDFHITISRHQNIGVISPLVRPLFLEGLGSSVL